MPETPIGEGAIANRGKPKTLSPPLANAPVAGSPPSPNRLAPPSADMPTSGNMLAPRFGSPPTPAPAGLAVLPPAAAASAKAPPHPADDITTMARAVAQTAPPEQTLRQVADGQEHTIHAVGTLLRKPANITQDALNAAFATAHKTGKFGKQEIVDFSAKLPPASNQAALRGALETQLERSIRALVVIHGEAQRRGIDLSGGSNAGAH